MTNQDLKRRLKELNAEESLLRQDIEDVSKITKEENFDYIKVVRDRHIIKRTLDKRKETKLTLTDALISFSLSLNLLSIPYISSTKLFLIIVNTLFLFSLMYSARSTIRTCYRQNLLMWISCAKKTLPEWKVYRKQMKYHLVFHLLLICLWFIAFNLIIPLDSFNLMLITMTIGSTITCWFIEYRQTRFNETASFLKTAKQVIALDHPNLYKNLD